MSRKFETLVDVKYLRSAAVVIAPVLALLCYACLTFGILPFCLKMSKVIPRFKAGDKTNITYCRFISILSCFSKILEKLAYTRTMNFLYHKNVLFPTQCSFRRNYSTSHAISDVLSTCCDNIEEIIFRVGSTRFSQSLWQCGSLYSSSKTRSLWVKGDC